MTYSTENTGKMGYLKKVTLDPHLIPFIKINYGWNKGVLGENIQDFGSPFKIRHKNKSYK